MKRYALSTDLPHGGDPLPPFLLTELGNNTMQFVGPTPLDQSGGVVRQSLMSLEQFGNDCGEIRRRVRLDIRFKLPIRSTRSCNSQIAKLFERIEP